MSYQKTPFSFMFFVKFIQFVFMAILHFSYCFCHNKALSLSINKTPTVPNPAAGMLVRKLHLEPLDQLRPLGHRLIKQLIPTGKNGRSHADTRVVDILGITRAIGAESVPEMPVEQ